MRNLILTTAAAAALFCSAIAPTLAAGEKTGWDKHADTGQGNLGNDPAKDNPGSTSLTGPPGQVKNSDGDPADCKNCDYDPPGNR